MMPQNTPAPAPKMPFSKVVNWKGLALFLLLTVASFGALFWLNLNLFGIGVFKPSQLGDMAVNRDGYVYLANNKELRVEKQDAQGNIVATFGREGVGDGTFCQCAGITSLKVAVDKAGGVYVAERGLENSVQKFGANGAFNYKVKLTSGSSDYAIRASLGDITVDSSGNLYILAYNVEQHPIMHKLYIYKYNAAGKEISGFGLNENSFESVSSSVVLNVDAQDNLWVADPATKIIYKISPDGKFTGKLTLDTDESFSEFAVDSADNIYISSYYGITKFDAAGKKLIQWNKAKEGPFSGSVYALNLDHQDNIYLLTHSYEGTQALNKLTANGQLISRREIGITYWTSLLFVLGIPLVLLLVVLPFHRVAVRRLKPSENMLNGQPLPPQIRWAIQSKTVYPDHLNLKKLAGSTTNAQFGKGALIGTLLGFLLPFVALIGGISFLILGILGGSSSNMVGWFLYSVVFAVVLGAIGGSLNSSLIKEYTYQTKYLPVVAQALGTLPTANRSVLVGNRNFYLGDIHWNWLLVSTPLLAYQVFSFLGFLSNTVPVWIMENLFVATFTVAVLALVTLINAAVSPKPGQVKLSRDELFSLYKITAKFVGIYLLITSALGLALDYLQLNSLLILPMGWVLLVGKSYYLLMVLGFIEQRWIFTPYNIADYDGALRRISFKQRFADTITSRLLKVAVLGRACRFPEAEYLIQEALMSNATHKPGELGSILVALQHVRLCQERYAESLYWMEQAIEINPVLQMGISDMAEIYLWAHIYPDRAMELIEYSKKSAGTLRTIGRIETYILGDMLINRAWALAQLGRHAEAEPLIQAAVAKANANKNNRFLPGISSIHFRIAKIRELQGNWAGASQEYWQSYELNPTGVYGQRAALYAESRNQKFADRG
jgi:tetratricopeptide (TPR) repeat protein